MRSLLRILLLLAIMASLALTLHSAQRLATGPELAIYRDALASEIVAATDRALAERGDTRSAGHPRPKTRATGW